MRYLVSDEAAYITGSCMRVDGGILLPHSAAGLLRSGQLRCRQFVQQRLPCQQSPDILRKDIPTAVKEMRAEARTRDVRCEDHVRKAPQGMLRR